MVARCAVVRRADEMSQVTDPDDDVRTSHPAHACTREYWAGLGRPADIATPSACLGNARGAGTVQARNIVNGALQRR